MTLHERLASARRVSGMTQLEVSRRSGLHVKLISAWESGRRTRSLKVWQLVRLAWAYGVTPWSLIVDLEDGDITSIEDAARRTASSRRGGRRKFGHPEASREILRGLGR